MPRAKEPVPTEQPSIPSVWTRPQRRRREQPALSRDQIVSAAVELLDTDGIESLSMRKLGTRLNAGATSLYTHVSNKDELIELVVDQIYGEIDVPTAKAADDWRAAAVECAHNIRAALLRHPWIASVLGELAMSHLGPNMMRLSEDMLTVFEAGGFDLVSAESALETVWAYVIGIATTEAAYLTMLARSGQSEQEWLDKVWPAAREAAKPFPRMRRLAEERERGVADETRRGSFEIGLDCVLDGVVARLAP
ncbi:TetR/AcrR family transcriptional regulator [Streptomyces sp. NPDC059063]|uniref:TetR/AcrR family transcriptional regulator n=1 Tax=unclassified Streptomyces TaxID=2593676 RepID=UPI0036B1750F